MTFEIYGLGSWKKWRTRFCMFCGARGVWANDKEMGECHCESCGRWWEFGIAILSESNRKEIRDCIRDPKERQRQREIAAEWEKSEPFPITSVG